VVCVRVNEQEGMCKEAEAFTGVYMDGLTNNTTAAAWAKFDRAPRHVGDPREAISLPSPPFKPTFFKLFRPRTETFLHELRIIFGEGLSRVQNLTLHAQTLYFLSFQ